MKKFYVVAGMVIVIQIILLSIRSFRYPIEEDYRQLHKKYEGLRYMEAREQVVSNKSSISTSDYKRLIEQINWMEDMEHYRVTAYLPESKTEKGHVFVEVSKEVAGMEGLLETKAIPLLVYQDGYKKLFGLEDGVLHYLQAILVFILMMCLYYKKEKVLLIRRVLDTLMIGCIVYLPELIWVLNTYGYSGASYPGISVGEIGEFPIYGIIRIMYLVRLFGIFTLGFLIIFLNKLLKKQYYLRHILLFAGYMLPSLVGIIVFFVNEHQIFLCGLSDALVMTNAMKFNYEYIIILLVLNIIIIAICKFYPIYNYSEGDLERMKQHFKD